LTSSAANNVEAMDSKGAQLLARLLTERHGTLPEPVAPTPLTDPSAAPVFRWLGIEPPSSTPLAESTSQ
jgi:hypothetical protein